MQDTIERFAPLTIEEGKFYCNRAGKMIGPMRRVPNGQRFVWQTPDGSMFTLYGKVTSGPIPHDGDLVGEWVELPPEPAPRVQPPPLPHQRPTSHRGDSAAAISSMVNPMFNAEMAIKHVHAAIENMNGGKNEAAAAALFTAINTLTATVLLVREM